MSGKKDNAYSKLLEHFGDHNYVSARKTFQNDWSVGDNWEMVVPTPNGFQIKNAKFKGTISHFSIVKKYPGLAYNEKGIIKPIVYEVFCMAKFDGDEKWHEIKFELTTHDVIPFGIHQLQAFEKYVWPYIHRFL